MREVFKYYAPKHPALMYPLRFISVEQDEDDGTLVIQANIVQIPPHVAMEMAVAMSTAVFPFQKSSRTGTTDCNRAYEGVTDQNSAEREAAIARGDYDKACGIPVGAEVVAGGERGRVVAHLPNGDIKVLRYGRGYESDFAPHNVKATAMSDRAELATAIQNLRTHCNIIIETINVCGAVNVPGFRTMNELLKRCDAVFRAFDTDVTLDRASAGEGEAEFGWVIEHGASEISRPRYWGGVHGWTFDNLQAVRFAREEDAQSIAESMDDGVPNNYRIKEHEWG